MESASASEKDTFAALASRALHFNPRLFQRSLMPLLHPRLRNLLQDRLFIRSAAATLTVAVGVATVQLLWFMRQVRDVEKDAKEEELPAALPPALIPPADDSDTELWEEEEPETLVVVKDSDSHWECMSIDGLIAARSQHSLDRDLAIAQKTTEDLMKARATHADNKVICTVLMQFIMQKQLSYLNKTQFVSCLSIQQVTLLFEKIKDSVKDHYKTYEAGEHLFRENDDSSAGLFLIKEGEVKVYSVSADGDEETCTHYRANESLGAFDIIDAGSRCVSALALTKTRVTVLSHRMFTQFCSEHPIVLSNYITHVIARFWRLASFTLYTFLELREQHPKPLDVVLVEDCTRDCLHTAASTRKVFKCGSVVNFGLDEPHRADAQPLPSSPTASSTGRTYATIQPNSSVIAPKDVSQFAVLVVEGSAVVAGHSDSTFVTPGHIIGLANLLATDRAIADARYPPPDIKAGAAGLTYLIVTVSMIINACGKIEDEGDSAAGQSMCQMLNDAAKLLLPRCREMLTRGLHRMNISSGETLFRRNDPASSIYLIVSGRMRTSRPQVALADKIETDGLLGIPRNDRATGRALASHDYGRNEIIGMKEVILGNPRTEDALCVRDVELVEVSQQSLHLCIKENPSILWKLSKQRHESAQLVNIGVLPMNDSVKTDEFVEELRLALSAIVHGTQEAISDSATNQSVGVIRLDDAKDNALDFKNSNDRMRAARWLFQQEEMMRFVILPFYDPPECSQYRTSADTKETWASIACAQCDIIFVLGKSSCSPDVTFREKQLLKHAPHAIIELVLLHYPNPSNNMCDPPLGTRRWILPRRCDTIPGSKVRYELHAHHHVRMDRLHCRPGASRAGASVARDAMSVLRQDVQRIARRLTGRSVALVLSGGGSRGLAHLGVIRALEDNGIPIDVIGGTSQGAFMAASFALSVDSTKMHLRVDRFAKYIGSLGTMIRDLTLPILSFFTGISFSQAVRHALGGNVSIEDLLIPFFCISTNLSQLDQEVHENGKLWPAVRASMTVVGLMPPMSRGGDLLVDGGYTDNLPLLQMVRMKPRHGIGCIIASDVERRNNNSLREMPQYTYLSGWRLLWSKLKPWGPPMRHPAHSDIVSSLMYISHSRQLQSVLTADNVKYAELFARASVAFASTTELRVSLAIASIFEMSGRTAYRNTTSAYKRLANSDYAKVEEIVQVSYAHARPRVQEWSALRTWQAYDEYTNQ